MPCWPQAVTQAPNRFDDAITQLATQVVDMHIQRVAFDLAVEAIDRILELFAAEYPTGFQLKRCQLERQKGSLSDG
jgi:predicted Zn-dependent protease with MMP-like domain